MDTARIAARAAALATSIGLATFLTGCTPLQGEEPVGEVGAASMREVADPAKLLTARPDAAILEARISAILALQNGCLVVGEAEPRTVMWPAGTILAPDRRAVIVPGARKPIAVGDRLLASGGTFTLESPPTDAHPSALANGCPGTLVVISELVHEG